MADLMETLMADPKFLSGLTLLGGANPRNAPLQQAAAMMMQMQQSKQKQENEKIKQEQEKMQTELYGQQVKQSQAKLAHDIATQEKQDRLMEAGMGMLKGFNLGGGEQSPQQQPQGMMQQPPEAGGQPQVIPNQQGMPSQPGQPQKPPQAPHLDFFDQRIGKQESGNQQFDAKTGNPTLGPMTRFGTRAVGGFQIMPSTAPEAAQLAGVKWNPEVFYRKRTGDPTIDNETINYNRVLGKAYFDKQFKDFGGRIDYASAAYNAGPEHVKAAIANAAKAKHPDIWTAFLPQETQAYLKGTGAQQPATPTPPPSPPTSPLGLRNPNLAKQALGLTILGGLSEGPKGFGKIGEALGKTTNASPGSVITDSFGNQQQIPDTLGERKVAVDERRANVDERRAIVDEGQLKVQQDRLNNEAAAAQRAAKKSGIEMSEKQAKDVAAFDTVSTSAHRMDIAINDLLNNKGLDRIFGATGGLISPRVLGADARTAAAGIDAIKDQLMNETLQAIRLGSFNGASGFGQLDKNEGEALRRQIASLDRMMPPDKARKSLRLIQEHIRNLERRSQAVYESTYNESFYKDLPRGTQFIKTENGKRVFKLPDGSGVIEE